MKTIKIIDLFNKMANGEEVPKKIKYNEKIYELINYWEDYECDQNEPYLFYDSITHSKISEFLNIELEIIEEDKKIEEIGAKSDTTLYKLENYDGILENALDWNFKVIEDKINILTETLIDVVNELKEDK